MAQAMISGMEPTTALLDIMSADDIQPGADPSYQLCKLIYLYHPLGAKMVDGPIKLATSKPRLISVADSPAEDVVDAFVAEWRRMRCDDLARQAAQVARTYGLGAMILGAEGVPPEKPLTDDDLWKKPLYVNVVDPLNTAGSIAIDQDPNSPTFQKWKDIEVAGTAYHRSRSLVLMNEAPVYISWTSSAFSFGGRSVYQRALFPMKSFIQSMQTDDMVTRKAGLLIAKINPVGAIVDNVMAAFGAMKRKMLQAGQTGGVLSINTGNQAMDGEAIESLNLQNIDGAGGWARSNVLKNIATAGDMPAWFLENETLTSGFGEGTEDANNILRHIDGIREWLQPIYDFLDPVVMRRAWNPNFFEIMKTRYPELYGKMDHQQAFYLWSNSFKAIWPNLHDEPESEKVEVEKVKLEGVVSILEAMGPMLDPDNKVSLIKWAAEAISGNKVMFPSPLDIDFDLLEDHLAGMEEDRRAALEAGLAGDDEDDAEPGGKAKGLSIKDSARGRLRALPDLRRSRA